MPSRRLRHRVERGRDRVLDDGRGSRGGGAGRAPAGAAAARAADCAQDVSSEFSWKSRNTLSGPRCSQYNPSRMPTAFLTGATGFVGGHVARALVGQGWTVRILVRDPARARVGTCWRTSPSRRSRAISRRAAIPEAALAGADAIVHVAGLTKARTLEDYREVNVRGTERLLAAAGRAAPDASFVIVSSLAAAGPARGRAPGHATPTPRGRSPGTACPSARASRRSSAAGRARGSPCARA